MAESPFFEGTHLQRAWDSTSLGLFKDCPRKYYYTIIEGWRSAGELSVHLRFGLAYHSALEEYDKLRVKEFEHDDALRWVVARALESTWDGRSIEDMSAGAPWVSGHSAKTRETLIRSIIWYLEQFKDDPAKTLVLADGRPAVELSFRMDYGEGFLLTGHLDRIVQFQGDLYVSDRKTTGSALGGYYFDKFHPDNQMSLYTIAAQVVFNTPVKGVIIDAAQIAVGFTRFSRGFTYRTTAQTEEWLRDLDFWLGLAAEYAEREYWPMNDRSCDKFGGCPFRMICSKDPSVRERFLESNFVRQPWNPLESR